MKNIMKINQTRNDFVTEDEITKILSEFPANDNICALSGFEDVPAVNDNEENVGFVELGFTPLNTAPSLDEDTPRDALEDENRDELNFYDEGRQKRGFLAEEPLAYDY
ncbi:MAG: hypothetical protein V7750_18550 [Sneathiella sp.]